MAGYANGRKISLSAQRALLEEVLARAGAAGPTGVVAFDLDSTVFDNRPRQARILREYGERAGLSPLLGARPEHFTTWNLADALRAVGLDEAQLSEHLVPFSAYWRDRFFTSETCAFDVAIDGAPDYLQAVHETGVQLAYATGRHAGMGPGTIAAMRAAGFPLPDGECVHLLLKPEFEQADDSWKAAVCARLDGLGRVVAAFDNEPAHINTYAARYPDARCVHLATDHSGRPIPLAPSVESIADFRR